MGDNKFTTEDLGKMFGPLSIILEFHFPQLVEMEPDEHGVRKTDFYASKLIRAWDSGLLGYSVWDSDKEKRKIEEFEDQFLKAIGAFDSIHPELKTTIEDEFMKNCKGEIRRLGINLPLNISLMLDTILMDGIGEWPSKPRAERLVDKIITKRQDLRLKSVFETALEKHPPLETVKIKQSGTRWRRIAIVDAGRGIWEEMYGITPSPSIPDYGNEFGDFLEAVFNVLWIDKSKPLPSPRRAADDHRKAILNNSNSE